MSEDTGRYLEALRRALAPLPPTDRADIVAEIAAHLAEDSGAVARLGSPEVLARAYLEDHQLSRALYGITPGALVATLLGRATRSLTALVAGVAGAVLYAFALSFAAIALLKPVMPRHVGWWDGPAGAMFGLASAPPPMADERLGWWIVPIALAGAVGCYMLGAALLRGGGRRLLRRDRPPAG